MVTILSLSPHMGYFGKNIGSVVSKEVASSDQTQKPTTNPQGFKQVTLAESQVNQKTRV